MFAKLTGKIKRLLSFIVGGCLPAQTPTDKIAWTLNDDAEMGILIIDDSTNLNRRQKLEKRVRDRPKYLSDRISLLREYYPTPSDEPSKQARLEQVEWLIKNRPDHPITGSPFCSVDKQQYLEDYPRIKTLWLKQVEKNKNVSAVLTNAAEFFAKNDSDLSKRFWLDALKLEPNNRHFRSRLAQCYSLWGNERESLIEREQVGKISDSIASGQLDAVKTDHGSAKFFNELMRLPSKIFEAAEIELAEVLANRLLVLAKKYRQDRDAGDAINEAHTLLGRIALKRRDLEAAKFHLAESAIDIATAVTTSFGPSLDLAKELAQAGDVDSVRSYLDKHDELCGVTDGWALELRFQIETGSTEHVAFSTGNEAYDDFVIEYQTIYLESRDSASRQEHLCDLINTIRGHIWTWSRFSEAEHADHKCRSKEQVEKSLRKWEQHLSNLKAMLVADCAQ